MEIAAFILSVFAFLMSGTVLVIYLAKHVFSSHKIQMVPVDSFLNPESTKPMRNEFAEFDMPTAMDIAADQGKSKQH